MSTDNNTSNSTFYFNQAADQWAITQILQLTTRDQLHLALHLLGLVSSSNSEHRKLSLRRIATDLGYSRQTAKPLKVRMVAAGLLVELKAPGRSSLYGLGPEFNIDRYKQLIELHPKLAAAGQLQWPFNQGQRAGASKPARRVDQLERSTGGSVRLIQGVDQLERSRVDQLERSTIEISRDIPLEISLESQEQPLAEVEPQASGRTAASPAEISEQPEIQKAESTQPSSELQQLDRDVLIPLTGLPAGLIPLAPGVREQLVEPLELDADDSTWVFGRPCLVEGSHPTEQWIVIRQLKQPEPNNQTDRFYRLDLSEVWNVDQSSARSKGNAASISIRGLGVLGSSTVNATVNKAAHTLNDQPRKIRPGDHVLLNDQLCIVVGHDWDQQPEHYTVKDLKSDKTQSVVADQLSHASTQAIVEPAA